MSSRVAFPAGTVFAKPGVLDGDPASGVPASTEFARVWAEITGAALIPVSSTTSGATAGPLRSGEKLVGDGGAGRDLDANGLVGSALTGPILIDLLNLPPDDWFARFVNRIPAAPAGEYSKIRVYYRTIEGERPDGSRVALYQTANGHFDISFVGGNLVVPATDVTIQIVGLNIETTGTGGYLLRPQVFATVQKVAVQSVVGRVFNVGLPDKPASFDLDVGGKTVHVTYADSTRWAFDDNVLVGGSPKVAVDHLTGEWATWDGAIVQASGTLSEPDSTLSLAAESLSLTFPETKQGVVVSGTGVSGWSEFDGFTLDVTADGEIYPWPDRFNAYYDKLASGERLDHTFIVAGATVKARGYPVYGAVMASWISIGP